MNAIIQRNLQFAQWGILAAVVVLQLGAIGRDFISTTKNLSETTSVQTHTNLSTLSKSNQWVAFGKSSEMNTVTQNFLLMGVFESKPESLSRAIISNKKDGEQELYQLGDKLPDGSRITKIENHRVILRRQDGQNVSIMMEEQTSNEITKTPAPMTPVLNNFMNNPNLQQMMKERFQQNQFKIPGGLQPQIPPQPQQQQIQYLAPEQNSDTNGDSL